MEQWFAAILLHWFHILVADALNLGSVGIIVSICAVIGGGILHFLIFVLRKMEKTDEKVEGLRVAIAALTGQANGVHYRK